MKKNNVFLCAMILFAGLICFLAEPVQAAKKFDIRSKVEAAAGNCTFPSNTITIDTDKELDSFTYDFEPSISVAGCGQDCDCFYTLKITDSEGNSVPFTMGNYSPNKDISGLAKFLNAFGDAKVWNAGRYLQEGSTIDGNVPVSKNLGALCLIGILMSFVLIVLQLFGDFITNVLGQGVHPIKILQKNLARILIVTILLTPPVYRFVTIDLIGGVTDSIANMIWKGYIKAGFNLKDDASDTQIQAASRAKIESLAKTTTGGAGGVASPVQKTINNSSLATVISGFVLIFSTILTILFPILQTLVFSLAYFLGPLCVPFLAFEVTAGIAKSWLSFLLTVGFWSVIGSLMFYVGAQVQLVDGLTNGGESASAIIILVFGILSIILFLLSYPIAAAIFGNGGGLISVMTGSAAMAAGAAGIAAGVAGAAGMGAGWMARGAGNVISVLPGGRGAGEAINSLGRSTTGFAGNMFKSAVDFGKMAGGVGGSGRAGVTGEEGVVKGQGGPMSASYNAQIRDSLNQQMADSAAGVAAAKKNWGKDKDNEEFENALSNKGYNADDIASVSYGSPQSSAPGEMVAATMKTGDQFRFGDGGWEYVQPAPQSLLQAAAGGELSGADIANLRRMAANKSLSQGDISELQRMAGLSFLSKEDRDRLIEIARNGGSRSNGTISAGEVDDLKRLSELNMLSAEDKEILRKMSKNKLAEIKAVGSASRKLMANLLLPKKYSVRDIDTVQVNKEGKMLGITMKGGEQFEFTGKELKSRDYKPNQGKPA